ncbi:MAG: phage major capsid protein, partial [Vampirovibrionales bacterium]
MTPPTKNPVETLGVRTFGLERDTANAESRTIEVAMSSEYPVSRGWYEEVLVHSPESIRLERMKAGAAVLFNHDRNALIGVVENVRLDADKRLRGTLRLGKDEEATKRWEQVQEGILNQVSIGYRVLNWTDTRENGQDVIRVAEWEPYEVSSVTVAADPTVGKGRALVENHRQELTPPPEVHLDSEEGTLPEQPPAAGVEAGRGDGNGIDVSERSSSSEEKRAEGERTVTVVNQQDVVKDMMAVADLSGLPNARDLALQALSEGKDSKAFREQLLEAKRSTPATPAPTANVGGKRSEGEFEDTQRFSVMNVFRHLSGDSRVDVGYEREVKREAEIAQGRSIKGLYVPSDVLARTLSVTLSGATGGNTVATQLGSLIDILRNATPMGELGVQFVDGLQGNLDLPKVLSGTVASWKGEGVKGDTSFPSFGKISLQPHSLVGLVPVTTQMLRQSASVGESLLMTMLMNAIMEKVHEAAILGSGSGAIPQGLLGTLGIGNVNIGTNGGALTESVLVDLETQVSVANALTGRLGYYTNSKVRGFMKKTPVQTGSDLRLLDRVTSQANGYNVVTSNILPSNLVK